MCVQCLIGAAAAGTAVTGSRWWLVARFRDALTPRRKRVLSAVLIVSGVLSAGLIAP